VRIYFTVILILLLAGCETAQDKQVRLERQAVQQQARLLELEASRKAAEKLMIIKNKCQSAAIKKYPERNNTKLVWEEVYTGDRVTGTTRSCFPQTSYTAAWCFDTPDTEPIYIRTQVEKTTDINLTKRLESQNACIYNETSK